MLKTNNRAIHVHAQQIKINGKVYTVMLDNSYYSRNMADKEIRDGHIKYCGQFYKIVG